MLPPSTPPQGRGTAAPPASSSRAASTAPSLSSSSSSCSDASGASAAELRDLSAMLRTQLSRPRDRDTGASSSGGGPGVGSSRTSHPDVSALADAFRLTGGSGTGSGGPAVSGAPSSGIGQGPRRRRILFSAGHSTDVSAILSGSTAGYALQASAAGGGGGASNEGSSEEEAVKKRGPVLQLGLIPSERPRSWFDFFFLVVLIYVATVSVFVYSFIGVLGVSSPFFWAERVVDVTFVLETALGFVTAYESIQGLFERHLSHIRKHYLRTWFVPDVISMLPWDYISLWLGGGSKLSLLHMPRYLRVIRTIKIFGILRMIRLRDDWTRFEVRFRVRYGFLRMCKLAVVVAFVAHWAGCLFHFFGIIEIDRSGSSWLMGEGVPETTFGRYIAALYFAMMSICTVGYGDITAKTNLERAYVIFLMFLGAAVFTFTVSQLANIVSEMSAATAKHRSQMDLVVDFGRVRKLPHDLIYDIRRNLQHRHYSQRLDGDEDLLDSMSPDLRKRVMMKTYQPALKDSYLLAGVDTGELCNHMCYRLMRRGQVLYVPGDVADGLYSVLRGKVRLTDSQGDTFEYGSGDVFGERELLLERPRRTTAVCLEYGELAFAPSSAVMETLRRQKNAARLLALENEESRVKWEQVIQRAERELHLWEVAHKICDGARLHARHLDDIEVAGSEAASGSADALLAVVATADGDDRHRSAEYSAADDVLAVSVDETKVGAEETDAEMRLASAGAAFATARSDRSRSLTSLRQPMVRRTVSGPAGVLRRGRGLDDPGALQAINRADLERAYIARGQQLAELEERVAAFLGAAAALQN